MLDRPPATVAETAAKGIELAEKHGDCDIPTDVADLARKLGASRTVDLDVWSAKFRENRPCYQDKAESRDRNLRWLMLGGAPAEGFLAQFSGESLALAAAAAPAEPEDDRVGHAATTELLLEVDAYVQAAVATAIRRVGGRISNQVLKGDAAAAAAFREGGYSQLAREFPASAAALTDRHEQLLRDAISELVDRLPSILVPGIRRIVLIVAQAIEFDALWEQVRAEYDSAIEAAAALFRDRVERYVFAVLTQTDDFPEDLDPIERRAPRSIAADVVAVSAGADLGTRSTPTRDLSHQAGQSLTAAETADGLPPDVGIVNGRILRDAVSGLPVEQIPVVTWLHFTEDDRAFTILPSGRKDHHAALAGVQAESRTADVFRVPLGTTFPDTEHYQPNPDPDHDGCGCVFISSVRYRRLTAA